MGLFDLFDWITGGTPSPTPAAASPANDSPPPAASPSDRRTAIRLDLAAGTVDIEGAGRFPIFNLSFGGIGIRTGGHVFFDTVQVDQVFPARVNFGAVFLATSLKVRAKGRNEIGLSFAQRSLAHSRLLDDFLKPRIYGRSLREIIVAAQKDADPDNQRRWFQGDGETQLVIWQRPTREVTRAELSFLDYVITFDGAGRGVQTGLVKKAEIGPTARERIDPHAVVNLKTPSHRALRLGRTLLDAADQLGDDVRGAFLSALCREERCSFHRFVVGEKERNIRFVVADAAGMLSLPVANLCRTALAFVRPPTFANREFPEGHLFSGTLQLADAAIPVSVKLVYAHDQIMGGRLQLADPRDIDKIAAFLAPRLLGRSLEEMPAPAEPRPFAPIDAQPHLFVGVHNTHLLSLLAPPHRLIYGRFAFMDRVFVFDKGKLQALIIPRGFVFPSDWELPGDDLEKVAIDEGDTLGQLHAILAEASLPAEIMQAWQAVLPTPAAPK